jgi:hypothetical protein
MKSNQINVISPYKYHGQWVFDDPPGNTYSWEEKGMEGWLCPALGKYYESDPRDLYCQVKAGAMEAFSTNRRTTNLRNKIQHWMPALNWGI